MIRKTGKVHQISPTHLEVGQLWSIIESNARLALSDKSRQLIIKCREFLDYKIQNSDEPIYGVNTGFGALYKVRIPTDNIRQLQLNLLRSHACGVGDIVPAEIVRVILFLKIQSLSYGNSGITIE